MDFDCHVTDRRVILEYVPPPWWVKPLMVGLRFALSEFADADESATATALGIQGWKDEREAKRFRAKVISLALEEISTIEVFKNLGTKIIRIRLDATTPDHALVFSAMPASSRGKVFLPSRKTTSGSADAFRRAVMNAKMAAARTNASSARDRGRWFRKAWPLPALFAIWYFWHEISSFAPAVADALQQFIARARL